MAVGEQILMGGSAHTLLGAALSRLFESSGLYYYILCAFLFTLSGLISGYFIWRKGHMQTLDAENEARRTRLELSSLRDDIDSEEKGLADGTAPAKASEAADTVRGEDG